MGLDGGSIPSRSDLLRRASWRLSQSQKGNARSSRGGEINQDNFRSDDVGLSPFEISRTRLSTCALSGQALPFGSKDPKHSIVVDELGFLFLRSSVRDYLLGVGLFTNKEEFQSHFSHLRKMDHVFEVRVVTDDSASGAAAAASSASSGAASAGAGAGAASSAVPAAAADRKDEPSTALVVYRGESKDSKAAALAGSSSVSSGFVCPITGFLSNGRHVFCAVRGCGHVFSEKALLELKAPSCVQCGRGFDRSSELFYLNGSAEQMAAQVDRLIARRKARHEQRKQGAAAAAAAAAAGGGAGAGSGSGSASAAAESKDAAAGAAVAAGGSSSASSATAASSGVKRKAGESDAAPAAKRARTGEYGAGGSGSSSGSAKSSSSAAGAAAAPSSAAGKPKKSKSGSGSKMPKQLREFMKQAAQKEAELQAQRTWWKL